MVKRKSPVKRSGKLDRAIEEMRKICANMGMHAGRVQIAVGEIRTVCRDWKSAQLMLENRLHRVTTTHEEFLALREFIDERLFKLARKKRGR